MARCSVFLLLALFYSPALNCIALRSKDGMEEWGYARVRPKAHLFWWLYKSPYRVEDPHKPWPIVLWLQGGPGASGVGIGNFQEIGPWDTSLKPRNSTWLKVADLIFVDNPVGTGFSFVEEPDALVKTDEQAAADLTKALMKIFNHRPALQKSPLYLVAESYGGKYAVTTALCALRAIDAGILNVTFGGVALGDSWISPEDFVLSWGPLLKDVSRLDDTGMRNANIVAEAIKQEIQAGQYLNATNSWSNLENLILTSSNNVDFYNFLYDSDLDPAISASTSAVLSEKLAFRRYSRYLNSIRPGAGNDVDIDTFMNGPIREKLKIIPVNVTWGGQESLVFNALEGDFMKPRTKEVDELLAKGVQVTVYNGQLDVICATKGTEAWVLKLKWEGLNKFHSLERTALYCGDEQGTLGFSKSYKNFHFYWILGAGHFVPVSQPCLALSMVRNITHSPAATATTTTSL
ncbi:hypothetical protein Droror1_Dr00004042 [Drosera rotundifolia]